jgi:hypothetical protein
MRIFSIVAGCLIVLSHIFSSPAHAQNGVLDLRNAIDAQQVRLVSVRGNGSSSGSSLSGYLENLTHSSIRIGTHFVKPIFLANSGAGQNMLATQVYGHDGTYYPDGSTGYISVPVRGRLQVQIIAYCVDFERDNPSNTETLRRAEIPARIRSIADKITRFERRNPTLDTTVASQIALWISQDIPEKDILERFRYSDEDRRIAQQIMALP